MKKFLLAAAFVAILSGRGSADLVLLSDNFDSYANQAAFQSAWSLSTTANQGTLTTEQSVSAPNSVGFDTTGTQRSQRAHTESGVASATSIIRFSFDFYDSNAGLAPYRQQHNLQDGASPTGSGQLVSMGLNNNLTSSAQGGNFYMARILGGAANGGTASAFFKLNDPGAPVRSTGWHNLRVDITNTNFSFYVDGILSEVVPNTFTLRSYDLVRIGSGLTSTASSYIDNVYVAVVPEASAFAAVGIAGLLSAGAVWIRKRRAAA
jgi:hypothetical protein